MSQLATGEPVLVFSHAIGFTSGGPHTSASAMRGCSVDAGIAATRSATAAIGGITTPRALRTRNPTLFSEPVNDQPLEPCIWRAPLPEARARLLAQDPAGH